MNSARLFVWRPVDDSYLVAGSLVDLPSVEVPPSTRVPHLAQRWCRERGIGASFVTNIGGIGRSDGSVHWGVWLRLDDMTHDRQTVALEDIEAHAPDPIARRLATALRAVRRCASTSSWIGYDPYWPERVRAWIARVNRWQRVGPVIPIRSDSTSIVASCAVDGSAVFFTTRAQRFDDATLCDALDAHAPGLVPRTLAYDTKRRWWLTADVGGYDSKTHIERDRDLPERLSQLMMTMANAQFATIGSSDIQRLSFEVSLTSIRDGVERAMDDSHLSAPLGVDSLWAAASANEVPLAWIHSDPSPDNVRVADDGRLLFIDMEDPWYGPAPLMGAFALHSMSRRCGWTSKESDTICAGAWNRYVRAFGFNAQHCRFEYWFRLGELVRLIRRVDTNARGSGRLLYEETPRRARAIASELQRLCGAG